MIPKREIAVKYLFELEFDKQREKEFEKKEFHRYSTIHIRL